MGTAARAIGVVCNAYRPSSTANPLSTGNRFLQLNAAFNAQDPRFQRAGLPANAVWYGICDTAYLEAGDYLVEVSGGRTWLVACLQNMLPALCILTNMLITVTRPQSYVSIGLSAYGGGITGPATLESFPASLLHASGNRGAEAIEADAKISGAVVLLPQIVGFSPSRGDVITDSIARNYIVSQAELNELGWRLDVRQAAV
ncbi:MAG: hypothetical protein POG24_03960 [Acidocella sp.]|nr:hypothetical protein [Acidocella sp.]